MNGNSINNYQMSKLKKSVSLSFNYDFAKYSDCEINHVFSFTIFYFF